MSSDAQLAKIRNEVMTLAKKGGGKGEEAFLTFLDGFYASAAPEDLKGRSAETLLAMARSVFTLAARRQPGKPAIRVFNPKAEKDGFASRHTVVQIVNDDMPFLVASVTGGLSLTHRINIHAVHHPIFQVERDASGALTMVHPKDTEASDRKKAHGRESVMHIEIDAQSGKDAIRALEESLGDILDDVRRVVDDFRGLMAKIDETVAGLTVNPPPGEDDVTTETIAFLRWLSNNNFTFLGYREFSIHGDALTGEVKDVKNSGLGLLRDPKRYVLRGSEGYTNVTPEIRHFLADNDPILITKANVKSTVHRQVHLDYVGVKMFDKAGKVVGERRFVGLFTSQSYSQTPWAVPILRQKVTAIQNRLGYSEESHAGRALLHILENFPRDEAFQASEDGLLEIAEGVLHLQERPRSRAFIRRDRFERFVSALVYVPRELYNSALRRAIEKILCDAYSGEVSSHYAQLSNDVLARWHFIIRTRPGNVPSADEAKINEAIAAAAKGWPQLFRDALTDALGEETGIRLAETYSETFDYGYREDFSPTDAVTDIVKMDALAYPDGIGFNVYREKGDAATVLRLKIYHASRTIPLSEVLPSLENLGLKVIRENSYELEGRNGACIHDFYLEHPGGAEINLDTAKPMIEELLAAIWAGEIEDDGYNGLILAAGLSAREILILRAYGKYLRQLGLPFAEGTVHAALVAYPDLARDLYALFVAQFDPKAHDAKAVAATEAHIRANLENVASLDEDRILRSLMHAIRVTVRTNYYTRAWRDRIETDAVPAPALAFKIKTRELAIAPDPKPYREIWVYSPRVEGVHLRFGPIARGGLRWSDRRDDFRTEILGLVKAQNVKNAVIVPVGAKGGFFPKLAPSPAVDRDAWLADGTACYRIFITTLLSVTDNLVKGAVVAPKDVVRHDGDDPYLVVAADKGTATFSDTANALSLATGHWLGDAFASGGSVGYDHKKMGITAKGGWISVQRHFRELGVNVQTDTVRAVGVGDMSGDVFGNGMLLTRTLKLVAAFDHRHIFLDPDPDPEASFVERERMFNLPRSSWDDYDKSKISKGGGVYARSLKSIPISPEVKAALDLQSDAMSPSDLMQAILKAPADLLWFGGIGTHVRASSERDADVGDRTNDPLRVTAAEVRAKVIGEGANLGLTQEGRIEAALAGVKCNTDFIDNSAGVDCSDKEVNIKILLADAIQSGSLKEADREKLLAEMTDDVAKIVLEDNYLQTQAISVAEAQGGAARDVHHALIAFLEKAGRLDRKLENLPTVEQFRQMGDKREGLARPELAILIAYDKMWVLDELVDSPLMDSQILRPELEWGFPAKLRQKFGTELGRHQLKKHIVATTLANQMVNRAGIGFTLEVHEETGASVPDIATAYLIVREAFGFERGWHDIDALDYKVPASLQIAIQAEVAAACKRFVIWILKHLGDVTNVAAAIDRIKPGVEHLLEHPLKVLTAAGVHAYDERVAFFRAEGMPDGLAKRIAGFEAVSAALDIVAVAEETQETVTDAGAAYFAAGQSFGYDWLRGAINGIATDDNWDRLALNALIEDVAEQQRTHTARILKAAPTHKGAKAITHWCEDYPAGPEKAWRLVGELKSSGSPTVAKVSFAARQFRAVFKG